MARSGVGAFPLSTSATQPPGTGGKWQLLLLEVSTGREAAAGLVGRCDVLPTIRAGAAWGHASVGW